MTTLTAVTVLVAACGSAPSPGVANLGKTKTTTSQSSSASNGGAPTGGGGGLSTSGGAANAPHSSFSIATGSRGNALKLSACIRAHGVPDFPDPNASGAISSASIDPSSPQFQAAMRKCRKYAGRGGAPSPAQQAQAQADALKFSACMRSHGVTGFPDPQFQAGGGISIRLKAGPGTTLDPQSPIFQRAQKACGGPGGPGAKSIP
ncbi:MAG TPA: hypothetical protein VGG41_16090 [Solirubrobacteraceae bacterium]